MQTRGIVFDSREKPEIGGFPIDAAAIERAGQSRANLFHAVLAAHFRDETAAGLERAPHSGSHGVGIANPVQRGVAEDGVEFVVEGELIAAHHARIEMARTCGLNLRDARIDADDPAAHPNELFGQCAIAAAEIEDAFARLRGEQFDNGRAEISDKSSVARVALGIPRLHRTGRFLHKPRRRFNFTTEIARRSIRMLSSHFRRAAFCAIRH